MQPKGVLAQLHYQSEAVAHLRVLACTAFTVTGSPSADSSWRRHAVEHR
jgi:hypothetical protein